MKAYVERVLRRGPATVDDIAAQLQVSTPEALAALSHLEIEGKVEEVGGRYRLVQESKVESRGSRVEGQKPKAETVKPKRSSGEPVKSREVCRVIWFDKAGKFAKIPKPLKATEALKPRVWRKSYESVKSDDGGRASIKRVNWEPVKATFFPPKEILQEISAARSRGDTAYVEGYNRWKAEVEREVLEDVKRWDKEVTESDPSYWERKAQASDLAKKGAASKAGKKAKALEENLPTKAKDELASLETKIGQVEAMLANAKSQRKKETLKRRKARYLRAKTQLEKIAQGRAYKWPSPALMR